MRVLRGVLFLAFCAVPSLVAGQASSVGDVVPERAIRITIGGELKLSLVNRNSDLFRAAFGPARGVGAGALARTNATPGGTGGDTFLDPYISLNIGVQLAEGVTAITELETPFLYGDEGGTNTTTAGIVRRQLDVNQLYVRWEGAFTPDLTLQMGIQEFAHDFVGNHNPFFVDVGHAESPFDNPTAAVDTGTPQSASAGLVSSQEAAGIHGKYDLGDIDLELFYFTIGETFRKNSDRSLYGVTVQTDSGASADMAWNAGAGVYVLQNDSSSRLFTVGGGGSTEMLDGALKVYGEGYFQFGEYVENAPGTNRDIDMHGAFAIYGGVRYSIPDIDWKPFIDISYWEISGDDDATDGRNENFVSLENNNDTIIVEDGYYGLDVDTNYRKIAVKAGFSPGEKVRVEALYAFFELQDNNGTYSNVASGSDKIGDEFDLNIRYFATEYLTFRLATGVLLDAGALEVGDDINISLIEARVQF